MQKAIIAVALAIFSSGCVTNYGNADDETAAKLLMGHECELTETACLPVAEYHFARIGVAGRDSPTMIEIAKGTLLRIVHFERHASEFEVGINVQAEAENGPERGKRVVIGELVPPQDPLPPNAVVLLFNDFEGLSEETGHLLQPTELVDSPEAKFFHYPWVVENIPVFHR